MALAPRDGGAPNATLFSKSAEPAPHRLLRDRLADPLLHHVGDLVGVLLQHHHMTPPGQGVTVFQENTHQANGLTRDQQDRIVACEHETRRVTRRELDGSLNGRQSRPPI